MRVRRDTKNKCGIYLIRNIVNGKVYIGASVNINNRLYQHIAGLRSKNSQHTNEHFIASWHKYGEENFDYAVLEECLREHLKSREFFWMKKYKSTNPKFGFNKRMDSPDGMITHPETSLKFIENCKRRFADQTNRDEQGAFFKEFWRNNPEKKHKMSLKLKSIKQIYKFAKMDEDENTLQVYDTLDAIIAENPEYKWQNIYAVCNGYKKRIYGFKWKKVLK